MSPSDGSANSVPAILGGNPVRPQGPPVWPHQDEQVERALKECWSAGDWGRYHGQFLPRFQQLLEEYYQTSLITLCSSGSSAMELALRGLKVSAGDEVIMAAYDFKANFQNVVLLGATPVLVDLLPHHFQIAPEQIIAAITPQTKAILVSHLHGGVVALPEVLEIAREHKIPVIEDACQCQGATLYDKPAGMSGDVGILSFGGSKLTTAGRGGAVLTQNAGIHQRLKLHQERGNLAYPLSELQAAVLIPQWEQLAEQHQQRAAAVNQLQTDLKELPGLRLFHNHQDETSATINPGYYKVGFQYQAEAWSGMSRDLFCKAMRAEGIAFDPGFRALHLTHSPKRFRQIGELTVANQADAEIVGLHHPVLLEPDSAIQEISFALTKIHHSSDQIKAEH